MATVSELLEGRGFYPLGGVGGVSFKTYLESLNPGIQVSREPSPERGPFARGARIAFRVEFHYPEGREAA